MDALYRHNKENRKALARNRIKKINGGIMFYCFGKKRCLKLHNEAIKEAADHERALQLLSLLGYDNHATRALRDHIDYMQRRASHFIERVRN